MKICRLTLLQTIAVLGFAIAFGGCASSYQFEVDAVRRTGGADTPRYSYCLISAHPELGPDDLRVQRVARSLATALSGRGMFEAPADVAPQCEIEFDFGIEAPVVVTRLRTVADLRPARGRPVGGFAFENDGASMEDGPPVPAEERVVVEQVRLFRKFLRITARTMSANPDDTKRTPLWSVVVENQDESDDLVRYTTLMAAAAMDVIDSDTTIARFVTLTEDDGRVLFVRTGLSE